MDDKAESRSQQPGTIDPPVRKGWLRRIVIDTEPLGIPDFRRLWLSGIVTAVGSQLATVAVPKQLFDLTGSSAWVGLAGAFAVVPLIVFGLWGGAIADAVDRRKLLLVTNVGVALTSVLLWAQAAVGMNSPWAVLVLLGVQQAFFAVNMPTRSAVLARLVPLRLMPSAQALNTTTFSTSAVFGPLLAGVLLPVLGVSTLFLIDAIALTATLWAVFRLPSMPPLGDSPSRRAGLREVLDGFRYVATRSILLASFLLDIIAMVAGMPRALFPEMAERTFGDPPGGGPALGLLYAAIPLGAALCGLFSGWFMRVQRHGVAIAVSVVAWGVAMVGFGLSGSVWWATAFLAFGGAADMVSMAFRGAMLQAAVTDDMRGRMQGMFTVVVAGGPRVADMLHGAVGASAGAGVAAAGGGVLVVVLTVVAVLFLPAFWRYVAPSGEASGQR
ncbi:MFS transporter [Allokutzneria multivorans]|uniref:MFS transporter n=1 Tax=Allokutzneria multivorans TaxID=1142134 RepID=A0ABP7R638_9PSEU